jgi:hypothetical protein
MKKQLFVPILASSLLLAMLAKLSIVAPHFIRLPQIKKIIACNIDSEGVGYSDAIDCEVKGTHFTQNTKIPDINSFSVRIPEDLIEKAIDLSFEKVYNYYLNFWNYSTTFRFDSDRNIIFKLAESPVGSAAPSISVAVLLIGIGIVGLAGIQR